MLEPINHDNIYVKEVATDILHTPFLSKEFCSMLFDFAKDYEDWESFRQDTRYSTHDCHLRQAAPVYFDIINDAFMERIVPAAINWWEVDPFEISEMFIVKYSEETQRSLAYHHDQSFISGSIKLNSNYTGGVLNFPHKKYDNSNAEVGDLIIWPSQVTHLHGSSFVEEGQKYSITIWTKQCTPS